MTWWQGALLTAGILGVVGVSETSYLFLVATFDFVGYCKATFALTFFLFAAGGAFAYGIAALLHPVLGFQLAGSSAGAAGAVVTALALTQVTRFEIINKTKITASPSLPGERESPYAKLIRWRRCALYCRIIGKRPRNEKHTSVVRRLVLSGLRSVYPLRDTVDEFQYWLDDRKYPADSELRVFLAETSRSGARTKGSRAAILQGRLAREDLEHAVHLAQCGAAAIIDRRALGQPPRREKLRA